MAEETGQPLTARKNLLQNLGLDFIDLESANAAFQHPSLTCHKHNKPKESYFQRLEFMGDHVLGFAIAEYLYYHYPNAQEGELSRRLTYLVRTETLAEIASSIDLHRCISAQKKSFSAQGHLPESILADSIEVLIGLVFDSSDALRVKKFILQLWAPYLEKLAQMDEVALKDAKSLLQEKILSHGTVLPVYTAVQAEESEDHAPIFHATVTLPNGAVFKGQGPSKRKAEHAAAEAAIKELNSQQKSDND